MMSAKVNGHRVRMVDSQEAAGVMIAEEWPGLVVETGELFG